MPAAPKRRRRSGAAGVPCRVEFHDPNPIAAAIAGAQPDQVTVSAINRNYKGRSGPGRLYLASPLTVAASAVRGHIAAYTPGMFREPVSV